VRREEPQPQGLLSSSLLFKIVPTSLEQIIQGNEAQELPRFPLDDESSVSHHDTLLNPGTLPVQEASEGKMPDLR
jgi:hypothetical protein